MSVIFQDPFMSDDQSFDKLLMELEYKDVKIESSIWQQYLCDFEEELKPAVWQKYVHEKSCDSTKHIGNIAEEPNVNKDTISTNQLDAWIEEILNLSPAEPLKSTSKPQQDTNGGQPLGNNISQMLQTEPSTLTVLDTFVNDTAPCSDILDLDLYHSSAAVGLPTIAEGRKDANVPYTAYTKDNVNRSAVRLVNATENAVTRPTRFRRLNSTASYASESSESSHYSSEDDTNQVSSDDDVTSTVAVPEPPIALPSKPPKKRKRYYKTRKPRLCQYLAEILSNPERNPSMMEWVDREEGIFRFTNSGAVARMWGQRRHKPDMKYENFARSLRTYIAKGVLRKLRSKLVYGFSVPGNWINCTADK